MESSILGQLEISACHFDFKAKESSYKDYRSGYQRDLGRIVHSAAFRRLQTKTQVMGSGEGDFHRTRLTHSIEVGQIGRGLCLYFNQLHQDDADILHYIPDQYLIEAICYAHDIGHPPFGHGGEVALHQKMQSIGGFEGNAQTLRQLIRLEKYYPFEGIRPTRRLILGVLKYPVDYSRFDGQKHQNHPPKCYYTEDKSLIEKALNIFTEEDQKEFASIASNGKAAYKSLDASIMEIADDIAYGVHDLEDAIARKILHIEDFKEQFLTICQQLSVDKILYLSSDKLVDYLFDRNPYNRKNAISALVGYFIQSTHIHRQGQFASPYLDLQAKLSSEAAHLIKFLQFDIGWKQIIMKPEIQTLEFKGQKIVSDIFNAIWEYPLRLIGISYFEHYSDFQPILSKIQGHGGFWMDCLHDHEQRLFGRAICDFVAQMTDSMAEKYYRRLYEPSFGSSTDEI